MMSPTARAMMMKMKRVMMETMNLPSVVCCCLPVTAVDGSPTSDLTAKNTHLNPKNHSLKNTTKNTSLPLYTPPPPEGVVKQSLQQGTQFQYQRKILAQLPPCQPPSAPPPPSQLSVPPAQVLWPGAGELESQWKEQVWWNNPNKAIDVDSMVKIIATPGYH